MTRPPRPGVFFLTQTPVPIRIFATFAKNLFIRTRDDYDAFLTDFIESFKNTTRKKESARPAGSFHANRKLSVHLTTKKTGSPVTPLTHIAERYSSGWNIGSQEGSMIGFWSNIFSSLAGMYFFSTTRRNM